MKEIILGTLLLGTLLFQNPSLLTGLSGGRALANPFGSGQQFSSGGSILPSVNQGGGRVPCNY